MSTDRKHVACGDAVDHHAVQLRGGGRLAFLEWDDGQGRYLEHYVLDDDIGEYLQAEVCVAEEASLRDVLLLVERNSALFEAACGCAHVKELLEEMRGESTGCADEEPVLVALELGWSAFLDDGLFRCETNFSGRSQNGEIIGIEFVPMADLADLPILLNEGFAPIDEDNPAEALFAAQRRFTVCDLVRGVFEELTVLGAPEERDRLAADIGRRVKDFQAGKREGRTMEELRERMAVKAEEMRRRFPCRECGEDARCACFDKPADLCHSCFTKMKEN